MKLIETTNKSIGTCPLCNESLPVAELSTHVTAERREIVQYTLRMIKAIHPEWSEGDGACRRCWEFYEQLGGFANVPTNAIQEVTAS